MSFFSRLFLQSNDQKAILEYDVLLDGMLRVCCVLLIISAASSGIFFIGFSKTLVAINVFDVAVGGISILLLRFNYRYLALWLICFTLYIVIVLFCIFLDIPSNGAPRSLHHVFLAVGIGFFLYLYQKPMFVRLLFPLVCFSTYIFFASSNWGIANTPYNIVNFITTHQGRVIYAWTYNLTVLLIMLTFYLFTQLTHLKFTRVQADLLQALNNEQFELYYQPQFFDEQMTGAEIHIYWNHPTKGFIFYDTFKTLAEKSGFVLPLGIWAIKVACDQLVIWSKSHLTSNLTLSIKVSAQELQQEDYVVQVLTVLENSGANPRLLKLELAECSLASNLDDIITKMSIFREKGFHISLGDFGTGYSSLSYLKRLPIDLIKIDQTFISDILFNQDSQAIARTIVSLANHMNLEVIADGVETEAQYNFLKSLGCFNIQGGLVSPPLSLSRFEVFISNHINPLSLRSQSVFVHHSAL